MNSLTTLKPALHALDQTIAHGCTSPRRIYAAASHTANQADEDHEAARADYLAQRAILQDLRQRLERAEIQLADDARRMEEAAEETIAAVRQAAQAEKRWIATRDAARHLSTQGRPAIKPLTTWTGDRPKLPRVRIPSRASKYPKGSTPYNVMTEHARRRRRIWARRSSPSFYPAAHAAHSIWYEATIASR